jgi:hypothetical protein
MIYAVTFRDGVDHLLAVSVHRDLQVALARALGATGEGADGLCAHIRTLASDRDQKPSWELRVPGEQCHRASSDDHGGAHLCFYFFLLLSKG